MKLNFKAAFEALLRSGKHTDESDLPVSMVLLLSKPDFLGLEELRSSAERAFGTPFSVSRASVNKAEVADAAQYCVMQAALFTLMKVGHHTLSFLNYTKPYGEADFWQKFSDPLPSESQREAWFQHKAWTAVNYAKGGTDLSVKYAVLARLCVEMLSVSCVGVYLPRERSLIPNDGSLLPELHRMGSLCDRAAGHGAN